MYKTTNWSVFKIYRYIKLRISTFQPTSRIYPSYRTSGIKKLTGQQNYFLKCGVHMIKSIKRNP